MENATKYTPKINCFAYSNKQKNNGFCTCLSELVCDGRRCKFYKTDINGKYPKEY